MAIAASTSAGLCSKPAIWTALYTGVLTCESGVLLSDILRLIVPAGWFLPAVPGTCFVTVGGAIANDVHGKNHHVAGTFGRHVKRLELLRSNGERLICSPTRNADWFAATIGGLGLTGVVTWAELQLKPISSPRLDAETIRFANLDEFFSLCDESEISHEYTVAWIDCHGRGRGIFQRANHAHDTEVPAPVPAKKLSVPFALPISLVNGLSVRLFNTVHYYKQPAGRRNSNEHFQSFFFPLDGVLNWNRVYGRAGFYQYQCVVPTKEATAELLDTIARSGQGSFLAVLKRFGSVTSPGMLSFPRAGLTLAIDFPNSGAGVQWLFESLDTIVSNAGGTLYPAKDGRMPGELFRSGYPRWQEFSRFIDPACSSSFWRRATASAPAAHPRPVDSVSLFQEPV
jgi:FAD/FMN-containing dehydrogenase